MNELPDTAPPLLARPVPGKRLLDVLLSGAGLLLLSPLLLLIALSVALTMGRPVLFRQTRIGRGEQPFTLRKFRTMRPPRHADEPDAARLTWLGQWLRKTSLDELPELWNVLRGEMSLVGPRPLLPAYLPFYTEAERVRHTVRPGLTGWAQIHGRHETAWDERLARDVWYVRHATLGLDLRILVRTVGVVLRGTGGTPPPEDQLPRLDHLRTARPDA